MPDGRDIRWGRTAAIVGGILAIGAVVNVASPDWSWDDEQFHHEWAAADIGYHSDGEHAGELDVRADFDSEFESAMDAYEAEMEDMAERMEMLADELDSRDGQAPEIEAEIESLGIEMGRLGARMAGEGLKQAFAN